MPAPSLPKESQPWMCPSKDRAPSHVEMHTLYSSETGPGLSLPGLHSAPFLYSLGWLRRPAGWKGSRNTSSLSWQGSKRLGHAGRDTSAEGGHRS